MPTGYTSIIENDKDVTFRDFALRCARAFGACMHMRDDALGPAPEQVEVSEFTVKQVDKCQAKLNELNAMTESERLAFGENAVAEETKRREDSDRKEAEQNERYRRIRQQVVDWTPDDKLAGLKKFMLEQIDMCYHPNDPIRNYRKRQRATPIEAYHDVVKNAAFSLQSAIESLERERDGVAQSNEWLRLLHTSIPPVTEAAK